jgi:hypothetical protein
MYWRPRDTDYESVDRGWASERLSRYGRRSSVGARARDLLDTVVSPY